MYTEASNCSKLGQKVFGHFQVGKCPINVTNDTCGYSVLKECLALFVCRCNFNVYFKFHLKLSDLDVLGSAFGQMVQNLPGFSVESEFKATG